MFDGGRGIRLISKNIFFHEELELTKQTKNYQIQRISYWIATLNINLP